MISKPIDGDRTCGQRRVTPWARSRLSWSYRRSPGRSRTVPGTSAEAPCLPVWPCDGVSAWSKPLTDPVQGRSSGNSPTCSTAASLPTSDDVRRPASDTLLELSTALASWRWWATITPSRSRDGRPRQPRGITERGAVTVDGAESAFANLFRGGRRIGGGEARENEGGRRRLRCSHTVAVSPCLHRCGVSRPSTGRRCCPRCL
jgi:hypothetical protein